MIKFLDVLIFFLIISISGFVHFRISKQNKEIQFLLNESQKLNYAVDLKKINWAYIKRPENLNFVNRDKKLNLIPINLDDIIYLQRNENGNE